jgi:tight adherence protein B
MPLLTLVIVAAGLMFLIITGAGAAVVISTLGSSGDMRSRLEMFAALPDENLRSSAYRRPNVSLNRIRARVNSMLSVFASRQLSLQLLSANWPVTETEFVLIRIWLALAGFFGGWLMMDSLISGVGLMVIGAMLPPIYLRRRIHQRRLAFAAQLTDVLVLLTGAVRAGFSLQQSLDFVVKEMPAPACEEFRRVQFEINLGLPLSHALNNLNERMQNDDLALRVTAININTQVGGNLVPMMKSVTSTIRDRIRLFGEVRALSSQQRFSSYILTLLPVGIAAVLFVLNPEYVRGMFTPGIALCFPIAAVVMVILGNIMIRAVSKIEV